MRYFEFVHSLGLHAWDIPALVALVILVIMIIVHHNNQKKRDDDFEKELDDKIQEIRGEQNSGNDQTSRVQKEGDIWHIYLNIQIWFLLVGPSCTAYIVSSNRCICCQKSESEKAAERSGRAAG